LIVSLDEAVDSKSCRKVANIVVERLSDGAALWAGDGRVGRDFSQTLEALFTVDMVTGEFLWLFVDVQTESTNDLFLKHLLNLIGFCHDG
jgi:hypothetical protein